MKVNDMNAKAHEEIRGDKMAIDGLLREVVRGGLAETVDHEFVRRVMNGIDADAKKGRLIRYPRMSIYWRRVVAAAAIVSITVGVLYGVYCAQAIAFITSVTGEVRVRSMSGETLAKPGMRVFPCSEISTMDSQGSAVIEWKDGSCVRLPGRSRIVMNREAGQKRIEVAAGYIEAEFKKQPAGKPALVVGKHVVAEIVGTQIRMDSNQAESKLSVISGTVRISRDRDGQTVFVKDRYEVLVKPGLEEFKPRRFYWADRYSGGSQSGSGVAVIDNMESYKQSVNSRFKGSGGGANGQAAINGYVIGAVKD